MEMVSLAEKLLQYGQSGACPMHMPGHKRNSPFSWMEPFARMDVTEIDGFDNLHGAEGILKDGMERMALLWGSRRSFFFSEWEHLRDSRRDPEPDSPWG